MKIRNKLLISILLPVLAIFVAATWFSYDTARKALEGEIAARADSMQKAYAWELGGDIASRPVVAKGLAKVIEVLKPSSQAELGALIQEVLSIQPRTYGSTIAFEPGTFPDGTTLVAPYFYRTAEGYSTPTWRRRPTTTQGGSGSPPCAAPASPGGASPTSTRAAAT